MGVTFSRIRSSLHGNAASPQTQPAAGTEAPAENDKPLILTGCSNYPELLSRRYKMFRRRHYKEREPSIQINDMVSEFVLSKHRRRTDLHGPLDKHDERRLKTILTALESQKESFDHFACAFWAAAFIPHYKIDSAGLETFQPHQTELNSNLYIPFSPEVFNATLKLIKASCHLAKTEPMELFKILSLLPRFIDNSPEYPGKEKLTEFSDYLFKTFKKEISNKPLNRTFNLLSWLEVLEKQEINNQVKEKFKVFIGECERCLEPMPILNSVFETFENIKTKHEELCEKRKYYPSDGIPYPEETDLLSQSIKWNSETFRVMLKVMIKFPEKCGPHVREIAGRLIHHAEFSGAESDGLLDCEKFSNEDLVHYWDSHTKKIREILKSIMPYSESDQLTQLISVLQKYEKNLPWHLRENQRPEAIENLEELITCASDILKSRSSNIEV